MPVSPKSQQNLQTAQAKYGQGIATKPIRVPEQFVPDILKLIEEKLNTDNSSEKKIEPEPRLELDSKPKKNLIEASEDAQSSRIKIESDSLPSINIILFKDSDISESTIASIKIEQITISFQGLP